VFTRSDGGEDWRSSKEKSEKKRAEGFMGLPARSKDWVESVKIGDGFGWGITTPYSKWSGHLVLIFFL
jgi:hypothetical protein